MSLAVLEIVNNFSKIPLKTKFQMILEFYTSV